MWIEGKVPRKGRQGGPASQVAVNFRDAIVGPGLRQSGDRQDRAIAACHQRGVPASVHHVLHADPLFEEGIEQVRVAEPFERSIVLFGASGYQELAVRQKGVS